MAQLSINNNLLEMVIKQDFRALYISMRLLSSHLFDRAKIIDPTKANSAAIKRMLGFHLSPADLITELKDTKSQTHKYFCELVITFVNLLETRHIIYLHEQIQKELKQRALDEFDDDYAERIHQLWLDSIRSVQLRDAQLIELLEKKNLSEYQALLLKKMYELLFYLAWTSNKQSLKILFIFFTDFYQRREDNEVLVSDLQRRLHNGSITEEQRHSISRAIDRYRAFQQAYNVERRQRLFVSVLNDPIALQERVNDMLEVEKQASAELKKDYDKVMGYTAKEKTSHIENSLAQISDQLAAESSVNKINLNKNQLAMLLRDIWSNPSLMDFNPDILRKMLSVLSTLSAVRSEFDHSNIVKLREHLHQLIGMMERKEVFKETTSILTDWMNMYLPVNNVDQEEKTKECRLRKIQSEDHIPEVKPLEEQARNKDSEREDSKNTTEELTVIDAERMGNNKSLPLDNDQNLGEYDLSIINQIKTYTSQYLTPKIPPYESEILNSLIEVLNEISNNFDTKLLMNNYSEKLIRIHTELNHITNLTINLENLDNLLRELSFVDINRLEPIADRGNNTDLNI